MREETSQSLISLIEQLADLVYRIDIRISSSTKEIQLFTDSSSQRREPNKILGDLLGDPGSYTLLLYESPSHLRKLESETFKSAPLAEQALRRQMFLYEACMQLREYLLARERSCQAALQELDALWNG